MAERQVVGVIRDRRGRVRGLVNGAEHWSPISEARAIGQIRSGLHTYYTGSPTARRRVLVVQGSTGYYLRSAADVERANNLDHLPSDAGASFGSIFVEVSRSALQRVLRAMHAAGSLRHHEVQIVEDRIVDLTIGCHVLGDSMMQDSAVHADVRVAVVAWLRRLDDALDPGASAYAEVVARARCFLVTDDAGGTSLVTDWARTSFDDVVVTADDPESARLTRVAVLEWAKSAAGGRFMFSGVPTDVGGLTDAELTFVVDADPRARVSGAMAGADRVSGPPPRLGYGDWSLGLQAEEMERRIVGRLGEQLGGTPPPYGPDEVPVGDDFSLTGFDADLRDDGIVFSGRGRSRTGLSISAEFTVDTSVVAGANGTLTATIESIDVSVNEWYAKIADFFSAGGVRRLITTTIRRAFDNNDEGLGNLVRSLTARTIASLGTTAKVKLTVRQTGAIIQHGGAVVWGEIATPERPGPIAALALVGLSDGLIRLDALGSWAPGGDLAAVKFDFGDGDTAQFEGQKLALVTSHRYASGEYTARVLVTDDSGKIAERTKVVRVT